MPKTSVQGSKSGGYLAPVAPIDPDLLREIAQDMAPLYGGPITSKAAVLQELSGIKAAVRTWYDKQPDQVIREASAYSARLTELWTDLRILEATDRQYTQLRTMQVQPVLDEIERQYRYASSRIAMARQDLDMLRG